MMPQGYLLNVFTTHFVKVAEGALLQIEARAAFYRELT
jgi:hypothetical protein